MITKLLPIRPRLMRIAAGALLLAALQSAAAQGQGYPYGARPNARPSSRPTVSVPDFKNSVTQRTWWWQGPVATDLAAALANELQASGTLQLVERSELKQVLSEQELAELGLVPKNAATARRGGLRGARYIVLGTVSSYDSNVASKGGGSSFGLLGFGTSNEQLETRDYVAIDIRVVDSRSGELVGSRTVEGRASSVAGASQTGISLWPAAGLALFAAPNMGRTGQALTGAAGTLRFGTSSAQAERTPAAKAIRAALVAASDYVSCLLVPQGDCLVRLEAEDQERRRRNRGVLQLE